MQSKTKTWFDQRAGGITPLRMYNVVHTSVDSPSLSLIRTICYPQVFSTTATDWGRVREKDAQVLYVNNQVSPHESVNVSASGLVLNQNWPFLGASLVLAVVPGSWRLNALISTVVEQ